MPRYVVLVKAVHAGIFHRIIEHCPSPSIHDVELFPIVTMGPDIMNNFKH